MKVILIIKVKDKEKESYEHKYTEHIFEDVWIISKDFDFEGNLCLFIDDGDNNNLESFKIKSIKKIKVKLS